MDSPMAGTIDARMHAASIIHRFGLGLALTLFMQFSPLFLIKS
jgi:hypothetical protein